MELRERRSFNYNTFNEKGFQGVSEKIPESETSVIMSDKEKDPSDDGAINSSNMSQGPAAAVGETAGEEADLPLDELEKIQLGLEAENRRLADDAARADKLAKINALRKQNEALRVSLKPKSAVGETAEILSGLSKRSAKSGAVATSGLQLSAVEESNRSGFSKYLTIDKLRDMEDLQRQAESKVRQTFYGEDSDSDSDSDSDDVKGMKRDSRNKKRKQNKRKKGRRKRLLFPQDSLKFEYVTQNKDLGDLDIRLFVAGEIGTILKMVQSEVIDQAYGRLRLLEILMYHAGNYQWSAIKTLYTAVMENIDNGVANWDTWEAELPRMEAMILMPHVINKSVRKVSSSAPMGTGSNKDDSTWFCSAFNSGTCNQAEKHNSAGNLRGKVRLLQHICAACWMRDKVKQFHPECSNTCPYFKPQR